MTNPARQLHTKLHLVVENEPSGPSRQFIERTRNIKLAREALSKRAIFQPTIKNEGDVIL